MSDESLHQPHDKLVKAGFEDIPSAVAFFEGVFPPAVKRWLDFGDVGLVSGSYISKKLRKRESDLVFRIGRWEADGGKPGEPKEDVFVYVLFEHQSTPERWLALRLLTYIAAFLQKFVEKHPDARALPVVLPVILAQNNRRWALSPRFADLFALADEMAKDVAEFIPAFTFRLIQLAEIPFDKIWGTPLGIMTLRVLKAGSQGKDSLMSDAVWDQSLMVRLPPDALERIFHYIFGVGEIDLESIREKIFEIENEPVRNKAMTIAEQFRMEGRQEGRHEGVLIGQIQLLQRLLGQDVADTKILSMQTLDQLEALRRRLEHGLKR